MPIGRTRCTRSRHSSRARHARRQAATSNEGDTHAWYRPSDIRSDTAADVGTLNIIYGIGALDGANIFVNDQRFVLTDLNTLGWVLIVLGVIQLGGGFSLMAGNTYGRVIGIIGGSLGAIGALLSIGGSYPWWSLAVFALCVYVVHGIFVYDGEDRPATA